jgi:hypothetical protein
MSTFFFRAFAFAGFFLALSSTSRADDQLPHPINLLPTNTFAPPGFDDNDNAEVVLQGNYISSCFRTGVPIVKVDQINFQIWIQSQTLYYQSSWCIRVLVPYTQEVDLGVLRQGLYTVNVADTQGRWHATARLPVAHAHTSAPDDFLYASATDARIEDGGLLRLTGTFSNDCMSMGEVTLLYRAQNIIEVLPKVNVAQRACRDVLVPFESAVKLNSPWHGTTLVHIRTMNGHAINRIAEF